METVLGEAPFDRSRYARFVLTPSGLRVRVVREGGATISDQALAPTLDAVQRVMDATLAVRDRLFGDGDEGGLYLQDTDGSVTRASPDRLRGLARRIVEAMRSHGFRRSFGAGSPEAPRPGQAPMPDVQWTAGSSEFEVLVSGEYPGTGAEWRTYDTAITEASAKQAMAEARRRYPTKYGTKWKVAETPPLRHSATINGVRATIDTLFYSQRHELPLEFVLHLRAPGEREYGTVGQFPTLEAAQREAVRLAMGAKQNGWRRGRR